MFVLRDSPLTLIRQLLATTSAVTAHAASGSSNSVCRQVDGDHRVGIFAARDMHAGSELFYDYKYDAASAPEWAKHRGPTDYVP